MENIFVVGSVVTSAVPTGVRNQAGRESVKSDSVLAHNNQIRLAYKLS